MSITMHKVPSYLKGLAETRARVSADLAHYQQLQEEISKESRKLKALYDKYEASNASLRARQESSQAELEACDRLILKYNDQLNPNDIPPIKAWKGRYGCRGKLKESIQRILKEYYPNPVLTQEIIWELLIEFKLSFDTEAEKREWAHNSVGKRLRNFVKTGEVERFDLLGNQDRHMAWKHIPEFAPSLFDLHNLAKTAGMVVIEATDDEVMP